MILSSYLWCWYHIFHLRIRSLSALWFYFVQLLSVFWGHVFCPLSGDRRLKTYYFCGKIKSGGRGLSVVWRRSVSRRIRFHCSTSLCCTSVQMCIKNLCHFYYNNYYIMFARCWPLSCRLRMRSSTPIFDAWHWAHNAMFRPAWHMQHWIKGVATIEATEAAASYKILGLNVVSCGQTLLSQRKRVESGHARLGWTSILHANVQKLLGRRNA